MIHSANNSKMKSTEYMLYKSVNLFGGLVIRVVPYYVEDNGVP